MFLDAGGVLILPDHGRVRAALGAIGLAVDATKLDRAHYAGTTALLEWPDGEDGEVFTAFNTVYLEALGLPAEPEVVAVLDDAFSRLETWSRLVPGALDGLAALAGLGVELAVVSNADGNAETLLRQVGLCQPGPGRHVPVAAVIDSFLVGVAKPDPRIFELALEATGAEASRSVHVGDIVGADVAGARAAGVHPLHFDPFAMCPQRDDHAHVAGWDELVASVRELVSS